MQFIQDFFVQHGLAITVATGWFALSCVLNILLRLKTAQQWVALAEQNPRIAALDKLLRAAGFDPAGLLLALQQIVTGKARGTLVASKTVTATVTTETSVVTSDVPPRA